MKIMTYEEVKSRIKRKIINFYKKFNLLFINEERKKFKLSKTLYEILILAFIIMTIIFIIDIVGFILSYITILGISIGDLGAFGDFFGGILNPIFTSLTLFALIITIVIQKNELKLAREEYSKTTIALNTQAIENTFFNTINLHYRIVENLKIDLSDFGDRFLTLEEKRTDYFEHPFSKNYSGIKVFDEIINKIFWRAKTPKQSENFYKILQDEYNYILGHYFRNLYQALKLIDKNEYLKDEDKKKYTSILRAQLSSSELALLFLNCLENICDTGQFKNLLIKFEMLEHLNIELKNNYYILSGKVKVSESMVLQYYKKINEFKLDLEKNVGGAYGKNSGVSSALIKYKNRELDREGKKERYIR
jgi:hypothetical protein